MRSAWINREGHSRLIIFYNGWGMDHNPFLDLESRHYDVLTFFDYRHIDEKPDLRSLACGHRSLYLVAWSMGVSVAWEHWRRDRTIFNRTVAINGTPRMVDDLYGIPKKIFQKTLAGMDDDGVNRFYARMCGDIAVRKRFLAARPKRQSDDLREELAMLAREDSGGAGTGTLYDKVLISEADRIVPPRNMLRYWENAHVCRLNGGHFPFYDLASWDSIIGKLDHESAGGAEVEK